MNITIVITEDDLIRYPNILDGIGGLRGLANDCSISKHNLVEPSQAITEDMETIGVHTEQEATVAYEAHYGEAPTEPEEPQAEAVEEQEPQYSIEEVRKSLGTLSKLKGTAAAKSILQDFGVNKVTDLKPQDYDKVMLAIKAVE